MSDYSEIVYTKYKDLGSIFYTKGTYRLKMYDDKFILSSGFNLPTTFDLVNLDKQGSKLTFTVVNREYQRPATIVLENRKCLIVYEGLQGLKLKM